MSKEGKHHYMPIFYLKQWARNGGRLCEYSRPHGPVRARYVHPGGTGFVHGLYSVPGLPPEASQYVEHVHLQYVDSKAAIALRAILNQKLEDEDLSWDVRIWWAVFLYGLILRAPKYLATLQGRVRPGIFDRVKLEKDGTPSPIQPTVPMRAPIVAAELLPKMLLSEAMIQRINQMEWLTIFINDSKHSVLTSDRPIIASGGRTPANDFLLIPLSPSCIFVATKSRKIAKRLQEMEGDRLVASVNDRVAKQALNYVYGADDRHLRFVSKRLKQEQKSPSSD